MWLSKKIFVTGTDTSIGKTYVSALLMQALNAFYWKPIQAGKPTDTDWIKTNYKISAEKFIPEKYLLNQPLSPHLAASFDNIKIDLDTIELPKVEPLIVEGAGGLFVPLNEHHFMIDLIEKLNIPTLIVASSKLGTINHTLLTINALRNRNIEILGVVINGKKNPHNREAICRFGKTTVINEIEPFATGW